MSNVIPLPKRPGRHVAHRADRFSHPAYRRHRAYPSGTHIGWGGVTVDEYKPTHRAHETDPILG